MPSKSELKALGERRNYGDRELDARAVANLSSDEYLWFQTFFPARIERAAEIESAKRHNKGVMKQVGAQQFWNKYWGTREQASPEEANRVVTELQKFQSSFPQFIVSRAENAVVLEWLRDRNMELNFRNLADAFEALALEGKVWLNPALIALGPETEVSGQQLLHHHNFHKLIQPQQRMSETDRLSAQEFYNAHKELHPKQISPFEMQRRQKAESTQAYFAQAASAEAKGNVVNVVDYGEQRRGAPPEPEKYSFKQKIRFMSASEIAARCQDDPAFRKALDELK